MHLFLSPHYDDAVFSCGGMIHRLASGREQVVVRTVMGGKPTPGRIPDTPIIRARQARWGEGVDPVEIGMKEDEAAVTSLGVQADHMVYWTDCVYRVSRRGEPLYVTEESLFGEVQPDDVAGKLLPTMVLPPYEVVRTIYAPLAVGHHVDHQLVRDWGLELKKQYNWMALKFYEEYPYHEDQNAVNRALEFFGASDSSVQLESETVQLNEADVAAKIQAIGYYESQITTFWADKAAMETATRAWLNRIGGGEPAERLWRMV